MENQQSNKTTADVIPAVPPPAICSVPRRLLENLLDNTRQLRAENHWWKDEPRMDYKANYYQLCDEIKQAEEILSQNDKDEHA